MEAVLFYPHPKRRGLGRELGRKAWYRRRGQGHTRIRDRRVSQLKKYLCYDNFGFDKKRYGKLKQAVSWMESV
jgi:hypothetical protein